MPRKKKNVSYFSPGLATSLNYEVDPGQEKLKQEIEKQTISFLLALGFYNRHNEYAEEMKKPSSLKFFHKTVDFWEGYKFANNHWFNFCKNFMKEDFPPKMRNATKKEIEKYSYDEEIYLFKRFKDNKQLDISADDYVSKDKVEDEVKESIKNIESGNCRFDNFTYEYHSTIHNKLIGIIDYRGDKLPVYDDDAGQCFFCKLPDGTTVTGGGWNPDPEEEFCYEWDKVKDNIKF